MPDNLWWFILLVVHEIMGMADILCKSLWDHGTLMCNQNHTLKRLFLNINGKVGIVGKNLEL